MSLPDILTKSLEGTRSEDGELRSTIHPRAMQEAFRRGLKVVPIGLHGTIDVVPKTMDRLRTGKRVAVRIGQSIDPKDFDTSGAFVDAVWGRVERLHGEARDAVRAS